MTNILKSLKTNTKHLGKHVEQDFRHTGKHIKQEVMNVGKNFKVLAGVAALAAVQSGSDELARRTIAHALGK